MTSEGRVCLGLADMKRYRVPYFGCSNTQHRKYERLCRGTESV